MSTYRERREARADQLDEWAAKREQRASEAYERSRAIADRIPFGQPILVGHHSERGHRADIRRIDSAMSESVTSSRMAASMADRAENIRAAAKHAIYSDDPDAIEQLQAKLERLEAERERIKAYNASCRKAAKTGTMGDVSLLDENQREKVASLARIHWLKPGGALDTTNLTGTITTTRKRIEQLQREAVQGPRDRIIIARRDGACEDCGAALSRGDAIRYNRQQGARCATCPEEQAS